MLGSRKRAGLRIPRKRPTEEQIVAALQKAESGRKVAELCCDVAISQGAQYTWNKQPAGLGVTELREPRQPREANGRLKGLGADLSLDRQILPEIVSTKL